MNERMIDFAMEANDQTKFDLNYKPLGAFLAKFAELIVQDHSRKTIQGLMSDPAFAQAMDEYYEQKWAHRLD